MNGAVVGIPTETVYGLGANALDERAVLKVFEIKNRPKFDPLIVHCASLDQVSNFVQNIPDPLLMLANKVWPGPLTLVLKKKAIIPDLVTSGLDSVAIRIPNHPLTLALLEGLPFPLAAPSANPFTYVSPTKPSHVTDQLGNKIQYVLDGGACQIGLESTILSYENGEIQVLRLGGLSIDEMKTLVQHQISFPTKGENRAVPGNFKKHYSNGRKIFFHENVAGLKLTDKEVRLFFSKPETLTEKDYWLTENGDIKEAARNVFQRLRDLDRAEIDTIYAEKAPEIGLGLAINDRLSRAAENA